ncbi:hypothetical protein [Christiangramia aquimixticola]|uniref:hypothetical protein n=1 Tax=Christiangramia aquimixticola TaxID=1697558 RepID=UPI003AA7B4DB
MKVKLLPNSFKLIGLIIGSLAVVAFLATEFFIQLHKTLMYGEVLQWIFKDLILLSLLMICFSKEKRENDKLIPIRFKHLKNAFVFGCLYWLIDSIWALIFSESPDQMIDAHEILVLIILFYSINFNLREYNNKAVA